jgi:GT2 family glycosyltransferase
MSPAHCDCSIVIPTRNRASVLAGTLTRLSELPQDNLEVIVVDNGSDDQTLELSDTFDGVRWIRLSHNLGCAARNVGAVAARGRIVLMLDDDSFPEPGVVEYLIETFDNHADLGAIACRVLLNQDQQRHRHDAGGVPGIFFNCGGAIRREAFLEVGGYPIDFEYYVEEYDLCCRLWQRGWRVEPHGDAIVWHGRVTKNRDNNNMLRLLVRNNLALWQRYAPDEIREQLIEATLERYHRVAIKENALKGFEEGIRQGESRIAGARSSSTPLNMQQFEALMGIGLARSILRDWARQHHIERVAIWGRGKGCEHIVDLCIERGLTLTAVYDKQVDSSNWRETPLRNETEFQQDGTDGLIVGTLAPGMAEDQLESLEERFSGLPVISLSQWIGSAVPAGVQ